MNWESVLAVDTEEIERTESLSEGLYSFFLHNGIPQDLASAEGALVGRPDSLMKIATVLRLVLRVKGLEAQAAEEELGDVQAQYEAATSNVGASERDLLDKVVQLEKEVRHRDTMITQLRQRAGAPSPAATNETRWLQELVDDLRHELGEVKRSLEHERRENERLSNDVSSERLRVRELDRQLERYRHDIEDYRRQLDWQRENEASRKGEDSNYKRRLQEQEKEISEQLDQIEEMIRVRETLEKQLHELTLQLGHIEEQRIGALRDAENIKLALVESDRRCDELETKKQLLEGQVSDLQEKLNIHTSTDDHIMSLVSGKAQEWEVLLSAKQAELEKYQKQVLRLQDQLRMTQRQTDKATLLKLKKQLQERDDQVTTLQQELTDATDHITILTNQLEDAKKKGDPATVNAALKQELEQLEVQVESVGRDLQIEVQRREEAELQKEEKDVELAQALGRLGEYERGEYGLHEAVLEIKMKKDELAVRDKDIVELSQHVNQLENQLNQLSEENETLRDQLGLDSSQSVDTSKFRNKRHIELCTLRDQYRAMEKEVEHLQEEKQTLRKQLVAKALNKVGVTSDDVQELRSKVHELERVCESGRLQNEMDKREMTRLRSQLEERKEQVRQFESVVKELSQQTKQQTDGGQTPAPPSEAIQRLIAMLEAQSAADGGKYDITLQLKSEVSQLLGQNRELREQLSKREEEMRAAIKELERKHYEVEELTKEVKVHRLSQTKFQPLPFPEGMTVTSSDIITSLNDHLLHVLKELESREKDLVEAQKELEKAQRKFSVIIHQQGILYKEHSDAKQGWERDRQELINERNQLIASREQDQVKVEELKNIQEMLSTDKDDQKQRMVELSRKITVLRVNEKALSRRYTLLQESENLLRKEADSLKRDMVLLEKAVTERMGYLKRHKEASLFKISSLQHQLAESVPRAVLDKANQQYNELVLKYQECLHQQTSYTAATSNMERLQAEVKTLSEQLECVKQELAVEKQKCRLLEETTPTSTTPSAGSHTHHGGGVAERMATLEMKELNERQRAELAHTRCKHLQDTVLQLEQRNTSLESKFSELTQKLLTSQVREGELRDQLASCLPEAEKTALEAELMTLKKSQTELNLENSHLKEVADVARQQVVFMETKQKSHDVELSSLRHQLLDLQMQNDSRTVMGKLHHQLVTLQVSEASALKKAEEYQYKVMQLEAALVKCEQERDKLSESLFHVKCETQNKTGHLRNTIQVLRRQYAGAVPLSEQEHHVHLLQQLREDKLEAERVKELARKDQETAQMKLAELELQHSNLQELMGTLKEQSSSVSSTAGRLTEWHAKMGEMRLQELRLKRTNEKLQEQLKHAEELVSTSERSFMKLEQDLVQVTKDYESAQLSWEHREMELEQQVEQLQKQLSVQSTAVGSHGYGQDRNSDAVPDKQQPLNVQLEQALSHLQDKNRMITEMRAAAKRAEQHSDGLEKALTRTQNDLLNKEKEISELRMKVSRLPVEEEDHSRLVIQRELRLAQDRIGQLQIQVSQKEQLVEKYQHLLQGAREELSTATQAHKIEVNSLMKQLHSQTDSALSRLKEAELEAVNIPQPILPTDEQLDRLKELEELKVKQEKMIGTLRDEIVVVRQQLKQVQQDSKKSLNDVKQHMEEMRKTHSDELTNLQSQLECESSRVIELEQEVEVMEGELSAAQQAAKQAPSRTMKALVERLRNQLAVKEKQQRALSQALSQVRSDLVETARKTLEGEASREIQEANVKVLVEKRTKELQDQLQEVRDHFESQLRESQRREGQSQSDVSRLEEELREKTAIVKRLEGEIQLKRKTMEQTKSREQRLNHEIQELRSRLDQSSGHFELQNRVKILQGKLDKQKQLIKGYEEALKDQKQSSITGGGRHGGVDAASAQIDSKHHSVDVMKWEESKKWQRRVDTLRAKLSEKNKDLEGVQKQLTSLKEMLARSDREKGILQGKLRSTQKAINEAGHGGMTGGHRMTDDRECVKMEAQERHELKTKIFELENEVQRLQHQLKLNDSTQLYESQLKCEQLSKSVKVLETQLQQQPEGSRGGLDALREHERQLQDELLQCQRENLRLQLEYEQAMVDVPRLKSRVKDQSEYIEVLKSEANSTGNLRAPTKEGQNQRSVSELERVITAMRKVVERLQSENEALKKTRQTKSSSATGGGRVTTLETENRQLKSEVEKLRSTILLSSKDHQLSSKSPYAKIVADNERLQKDLKKEVEKNDKLQLSLTTLEVHNKKLQQELAEHSIPHPIKSHDQSHDSRYYEERLETLQAEVEKKTTMLMEVKKHLREAVEREQQLKSLSRDTQLSDRYLAVLKERDSLQQQVKQLKKELDAFDPNFFEELEDLKYNYQEAVKKNVEYEEQLTKLSQQYGFKLPPSSSSDIIT